MGYTYGTENNIRIEYRMRWVDALKEWNKGSGKWCIPRKGSAEYDAVKAIMGGKKIEASEAEKKAEASPKKIPMVVPGRRLTSLENIELLVKEIVDEMLLKKQESKKNSWKGKAESIKKIDRFWKIWNKENGTSARFYKLVPYDLGWKPNMGESPADSHEYKMYKKHGVISE